MERQPNNPGQQPLPKWMTLLTIGTCGCWVLPVILLGLLIVVATTWSMFSGG